jgi:hypothetical protein
MTPEVPDPAKIVEVDGIGNSAAQQRAAVVRSLSYIALREATRERGRVVITPIIILEYFRRRLNCIAIELLDYYDDINCCSKQNFRHFEFQYRSHEEHVVASYHRCYYAHLGMEKVEQFVTFMAACELETFVYEHEDCHVASKFINALTNILRYCIRLTWRRRRKVLIRIRLGNL